MTRLYETAALIIQELEQQGSCTLDTLAYRLPTCSWNQVFMAVDVLSREGTITLHPRARCGRRAAENRRSTNGSYGR